MPTAPTDVSATTPGDGVFRDHLRRTYRLTPEDVYPTSTAGYWVQTVACDPRRCPSPLHSAIGNKAGVHHTVAFRDHYRDRHGRWCSPYATWRRRVAQLLAATPSDVERLRHRPGGPEEIDRAIRAGRVLEALAAEPR